MPELNLKCPKCGSSFSYKFIPWMNKLGSHITTKDGKKLLPDVQFLGRKRLLRCPVCRKTSLYDVHSV